MNKFLLILNVAFLASCLNSPAEEPKKIEDFFPPEVKVEVKREPLKENERNYLKRFGVDERTLDIFGPIFVKGYSADTLRWGDIRPDDLGDMKVKYETEGMAKLSALPPPGTHPRMFFTDADRAAHRNRLEKTKGGKEAMKILMGYTELLKGKYDPKAEYSQPDTFKGSMGTHGFLPLFRAGNNNDVNRKIWEAYSDGRLPEGLGKNYCELNPGLCALEAFRCWVYEDAEGAKKVAKAMETALRTELAKLHPGKLPEGRYFNFNLAYVYDFIYNYLTPEQRNFFRNCIVAANFDSNQYGVFQNAENTTSNWTTFSYRMHGWLTIEGDPGYNSLQYLGYKRSMQNYFTYGWFKGGCCLEAFGKNQIGGEIIYPMALRGDYLAAHPHILATVRDFLPHDILPWGNAYVAYDRWGGIKGLYQNDILPIKNLFPDDKRIDWVYRNTVHDDYSWKEGDGIRVEGYNNSALIAVLWTVDYDEKNNDPGKLMDSESFVDGQRGLVITRSDWTKNALYLQHHVRGQSGGHVFADRSSFLIGGRGRIWLPNGSLSYSTKENNVVMIDGTSLSNRAPAHLADYKRTPLATFSTADLKDTINYEYDRLYILDKKAADLTREDSIKGNFEMAKGWEREMATFNDYALFRDTSSILFTTPRFERPDWISIGKIETSIRKPREGLQVSKAFRTIGMIRPSPGTKGEPYVLCLDDFTTSDGKVHTYDWQARLAPDLSIINVRSYSLDKDGKPAKTINAGEPVFHDIFMAPQKDIQIDANQRAMVEINIPVLLVRILQMDSDPKSAQSTNGIVNIAFPNPDTRQLVIKTVSKNPNFKILVYPHLNRATPLPETVWDKDRKNLTVKIGRQVDRISFSVFEDGRTVFDLKREGENGRSEEFSYMGNEYQKNIK